MNRLPHLIVLLSALLSVSSTRAQVTVAESSDYARTSSYADVVAFLDALEGDLVTHHEFGTTVEGRTIPMVIVADPPVHDPSDLGDRVLVLAFGNIHAGEVCGKEALCMLARELAKGDPVLEHVAVALVPIYNADGNERFGPDNRPGQNGPEEMGIRHNAQDLDLNRDWMKVDAPETRAMLRFYRTWDPHVIIDTHTTNGSKHRYTLTYQGPKHPSGDADLLQYVRDEMLPVVTDDVREANGYEMFFYGNFNRDHTRWTTYPAAPRYGTSYRGLRHRVAILSEAYSYATFRDRVLSTRAICRSIIEYASEHHDRIRSLCREAEKDRPEEIAIRTTARPFPDKVRVLGYDDQGEPRDHELELVNDFVAETSVSRPHAYFVPSNLTDIRRKLQEHGIEVEILREDRELDVSRYTVTMRRQSERSFNGHRRVTLEVDRSSVSTSIAAGTFVVRTDQPLGTLAVNLLEPEAEDGYAAWDLIGTEEGASFPVLRLESEAHLLLGDARPLDADREFGRLITYDLLNDDAFRSERPNFGGRPQGGFDWVDADTFRMSRGGSTWEVDARTGRLSKVETTNETTRASLDALDWLDDRTKDRHASRDVPEEGFVFEYGNDLYVCPPDGEPARRLTSTPEEEELHDVSPDGKFVGFVRENDLWVADLRTGTERALTRGGHDTLRNGKASWVYFEEIFGRNWKTWWWAPDSRHIAFFETDSALVDTFTIVDDVPEGQRIEVATFPKPGTDNPRVRLAIAEIGTGTVRWVDLDGYTPGDMLVSRVGWLGDDLWFTVQNRAQHWYDFCTVSTRGGEPKRLFRVESPAWIEPPQGPWVQENGDFLLACERSGYRHLYLYSKKGELLRQVTDGEWEIQRVLGIHDGWIYLMSNARSPIASHMDRVRLEDGEVESLTRHTGSHRITLGETHYIDSWSSFKDPTKVALYGNDGSFVRWIDTNPQFEHETFRFVTPRHVQVPGASEGVMLEATITYPPSFDESKSYPVWFLTYGGPHAPTVNDSFRGGRTWEQMLAHAGIVVFRADPHAASGKGVASAWTTHRRLGVGEQADIEAAIDWISEKPWADTSRIGMSGHSFGGYITAYSMVRSDRFAAGIAGAPVTSWRDYDSIYTERYMDTPQENPDGYRETSVVEYASDLHGELLLLHGTMDDNVHMQHTTRLIRELQRAARPFEVLYYPGFRHGIYGSHVDRARWDFITRTMGVEPPTTSRKNED